MMNGFKRTFWSSLHKKKDDDSNPPNHQKPASTRFGFFSNPSTPRSGTRPDSVTSTLRCQSWSSTAISTPSPSPLHCRTSGNVTPPSGDLTPTRRRIKSPLSLLSLSSSSSSSTPSSPTFSLLKSRLCFSKSATTTRCGVCLQTAKSGRGTAIFTAECSHIFHFSCVASNSGDRSLLSDCPVCGSSWRETEQSPKPGSDSRIRDSKNNHKSLRVYNDDEPLITSPMSPGGFNTIPELDEEDDEEEDNGDFGGFPSPFKLTNSVYTHVDVTLTDSAIVAVSKSHVTSTVVMRIKSPPLTMAIRSPVDLVTVLDVSGSKNIEMVKKAMKIVVSSLRENDRLSIVSFSSTSKRLTPLKRMTANGKRIARRIVEEINGNGDGMSINDAVKKAVKVVEDRRQKNPFTVIFVLTDRNGNPARQVQTEFVNSVRVSHLDIAKHTFWVGHGGGAFREDAFAKRVESLLRFSIQDLELRLGLVSGSGQGDITSVYSLTGGQVWFGSGLVRLNDMYANEEREVLVEIRSPASASKSHRILTVGSRNVDPTTHEIIINSEDRTLLIQRPVNNERLRNRHVSTRAVAEGRRLLEAGDFSGAERMLTSARALLVQYGLTQRDGCLYGLDYELANLNRMRGRHVAVKSPEPVMMKAEPLTPTSAWRAAERLAKVAIMRKHMNRVSDLHGFENARF